MKGLSVFAAAFAMAASMLLASPPGRAEDGPTAAPAEAEAGRFTMVPAEGGFVRLDTRTGVVSHCRRETADPAAPWRCAAIPEDVLNTPDRLTELGDNVDLLSREVAELQARLDALEQERQPGAADKAAPGLSSDEETQRALDFSEELMRRFFGLVREMKRGDEDRT